MSNVYDHAYDLAKAIRGSDDFQQLKQLHEQVDQEDTSRKMMDDFRKAQMELQMKQMQGQEITEEEQQKFQSLVETVQLNTTISQVLEKEQRLNVTMEDIMKIVMEPTKEIYDTGE